VITSRNINLLYTSKNRKAGVHMDWESRYSERAKAMKASEIRELLKLTQQPDIISFAGGLPSPQSFPTEDIAGGN
jgi:DNA-binding transcriptional MocR family regulator